MFVFINAHDAVPGGRMYSRRKEKDFGVGDGDSVGLRSVIELD